LFASYYDLATIETDEMAARLTGAIPETRFYDDVAFRELVSRMKDDSRFTKDSAVYILRKFFGEIAFETTGLKKPFMLKQIAEHRNTQALRENRTDTAPG
jgi:hypothetical protein